MPFLLSTVEKFYSNTLVFCTIVMIKCIANNATHCSHTPGGVRSIVMGMYVFLSVCLLAYLENHKGNCFVHDVCDWAMARSFSDSYHKLLIPILWMTLCFYSMGPMGQNQARG